MAVTVISRPEGYKLGAEAFTATAVTNGMDGLVYFDGPNELTDGQYVYIESNIESYNGFWKVLLDAVTPENIFSVQRNGDADFQEFIQTTEVIFYEVDLSHGWQCVHLPIVYELESDLYPINSVDTAEPSSGYGFINGYFAVVTLNPVSFNALDYVKVGDGVGGYRIFQVVEAYSSTITVLNSDGTGVFEYIQLYRNNYHIDVNVYAGLPVGHYWEAEKPYELATTLKFIPDSNNQIKFSIAEILKGYITTRNNLTLDTLPNNIDFMTAFYIEFAEGYDVSDGTEITAFLDDFEEDDFEGYAVNAMLPFKNLYSGWISEYLLYMDSGARFLTTFDVPNLFENYFFDISILVKDGLPPLLIKKVWYFTDGTVSHTEYTAIQDFDEGVYRIELEAQCSRSYDVVTTAIDSEWESNVEGWYQLAPATDNWVWGNSPDYFGDSTGYVDKPQEAFEFTQLNHTISLVAGQVIRLQTEFGGLDDGEEYNMQIFLSESLLLSSQIGNYSYTKNAGLGNNTLVVDETINITDGGTGIYNGVYFVLSGGLNTGNVVYVNYFRITSSETITKNINNLVISIVDSYGNPYTEQKTINVICECGDTFVNDDLRLTEDGLLRELE